MFFYPIMYCKTQNYGAEISGAVSMLFHLSWTINIFFYRTQSDLLLRLLLYHSNASAVVTVHVHLSFLFLNVLNNEFFGQYLPYFSSSCHALCTQGLNFLAKSSFYCCKGQKRNCCDGTKMIIGWSTKVRLSGVSMWATSLLYKLHKFLWFYTNVIQIWSRILCNTIDVRLAYQSLKPVWMDRTIFKLRYVILVGRTQRLNVWQSSSILFCCLFFNV